MKSLLFPGTFDPPTLGHLDIIKRAVRLADKLYVAVATVSNKHQSVFSVQERIEMLSQVFGEDIQAEAIPLEGLVVDLAKELKVDAIVRGMRSVTDFDYEYCMAFTNAKLSEMETIFLMTSEDLESIRSTLIREIATHGRRLHAFVPPQIEEFVFSRLSQP
jgi:pantetheine-phosphate adenylyltransferase